MEDQVLEHGHRQSRPNRNPRANSATHPRPTHARDRPTSVVRARSRSAAEAPRAATADSSFVRDDGGSDARPGGSGSAEPLLHERIGELLVPASAQPLCLRRGAARCRRRPRDRLHGRLVGVPESLPHGFERISVSSWNANGFSPRTTRGPAAVLVVDEDLLISSHVSGAHACFAHDGPARALSTIVDTWAAPA